MDSAQPPGSGPGDGTEPKSRMGQVLAIAPFRNFWLANLLSNLGTNAYLMALSWFTVRQYGAAGIGALALGYGLPQLLLQLIGGSASDRISRRSLFFCTESGMLLLSLVLLIASLRGVVPLWLLVVVSAGNGSISAFDSSARTGLISSMVPKRLVVDAQQIYGLAASITTVIGPALGGVLLSLGPDEKSHEEFAFLFNTLSFLPLLVSVLFLPNAGSPASQARVSLIESVREGLRFVRHQRSVRTLLQLLAVVMLLGMPFQTLLPIFVHSHLSLQTGHGFYAALLSALGLGAFAGSLLGVQLGEKRQPGPSLFWAALGLGIAILLLCSSRVIHWSSLSVFLAGACGALVVNLDNALVEGQTPMDLQGRVSSIASLSKSFQTISAAGASGLIHLLSKVNASSGFLEVQVPLALLLIAGTLILRPGVWRLSQPAEIPAAST